VGEFERLVKEYESWLKSMGEEDELYTWSIGQYSVKGGLYAAYNWPDKVGVNIYDEETALAFKLKFGL
jgi:hypothetical protein